MVDYVSTSDFYEIRLASLLSNVDKDLIVELYQPIIGSASTILYVTLFKQKRNEDDEDIYSIDSLLKSMQISHAQLISARKFLEGVGLMKTYEKDNGDKRSYIYVLYAPKTPKDFFDDVLFKGLLIQAVGEKEALRLASRYEIDLKIPEDYKEVTASFTEMFSPDYNDPSFQKDISSTLIGHKTRNLKLEFKYDKFFDYIEENSQIRRSVFDNKMMVEIERIATLYGYGEKEMAVLVNDCYKPYEVPHLDFIELAKAARNQLRIPGVRNTKKQSSASSKINEEDLAKRVKFMDDETPIQFLSKLQGNTYPSSSDLDVIDNLTLNYKFTNGVINAIVYFTLIKCSNVLNYRFADKVAGSIAREQLTTALETINYLSRPRTKGNVRGGYISKETTEVPAKTIKEESNEIISDEEMELILQSIDSKKKGGKK